MKFSFQALGTIWWIELFDELLEQTGAEIKDFCTGFVSTYEASYSRFKSDSLVSRLNRERAFANPPAEFARLLTYGKQLYVQTDTHFNFLTGQVLESRGYDAEYSFKSSDTASRLGNPITDLSITPELVTLNVGNIDLGGFGKGYLVDLLVAEFKQQFQLDQFLINGGGDIFVTNHQGKPINIQLEHPTKPGVMIGSTTLFNQGFAASSPHKRVWQNDTGTHTHIVAETLTHDATFVKSSKCAEADAVATAALSMSEQQLQSLSKTEKVDLALFSIKSGQLTASPNFA